jgi:hypothetical protein
MLWWVKKSVSPTVDRINEKVHAFRFSLKE